MYLKVPTYKYPKVPRSGRTCLKVPPKPDPMVRRQQLRGIFSLFVCLLTLWLVCVHKAPHIGTKVSFWNGCRDPPGEKSGSALDSPDALSCQLLTLWPLCAAATTNWHLLPIWFFTKKNTNPLLVQGGCLRETEVFSYFRNVQSFLPMCFLQKWTLKIQPSREDETRCLAFWGGRLKNVADRWWIYK